MTASTTPKLAFSFRYSLGESGWNTGYDANWRLLEIMLGGSVVSATTTAEPGAPTNGQLYIVPDSATGTDWAGQDGDLAYYDGAGSGGGDAWVFFTPLEGMKFRAADTNFDWEFDGTNWTRMKRFSADAGITASTTQSQGQQPLTANINEVSTCANANDVVTAPSLEAGMPLTVINNGAQTLDVFPASGDDLGAGVDTAVSITAGNLAKWECYSDGVAVQLI